MSKYLITGVAGFVGRYFVEYLPTMDPNADICGVDIIPECSLSISYQQLDLRDGDATNTVIKEVNPDYIVHLASISSVGQSWADPQGCIDNNKAAILNILKAVSNNKINCRILSIGSSEEYGSYSEEKMPLDETMELNPINPYAEAKVIQESICQDYVKEFGLDIVMTRSFNHIGPRQSERFVIPSFVRQLVNISENKQKDMSVGNIEVSRDFLDVRDVVTAYYQVLTKGQKGEVYNVCSGRSHKLKDIIKIIEDVLGINADIKIDKDRIRPNDTMMVYGDNNKLRSLGWKQNVEIEQTIKDMITYHKENI